MKWKTEISTHKDGELYIRGQKLADLVAENTFTEVVYLLLRGKMPSNAERQMLDAMLVSIVEHSVAVPTAFVPRTVVSTGNNLHTAVAAGVLAVGDNHGGALENSMRAMQSDVAPKDFVADALARKERIAGYGHKIYKDEDPRATALFSKAVTLGLPSTYRDRAVEIGKELREQSGKKLPLNVDGAMAAILTELGFDPELGKAFFAFGRMPGMIAHAREEQKSGESFRRFTDEDVEFTGE